MHVNEIKATHAWTYGNFNVFIHRQVKYCISRLIPNIIEVIQKSDIKGNKLNGHNIDPNRIYLRLILIIDKWVQIDDLTWHLGACKLTLCFYLLSQWRTSGKL